MTIMASETFIGISYEQASDLVTSWVENINLRKHCYAVEVAMSAYAAKFDPVNIEKWKIAGLIHDADWDKWPEEHPHHLISWLNDHHVSEDVINAVAAHGFEFNIEPKTLMAKTLRAVDELTGLIVAVTLVQESKKLEDVTVQHVLRKWNKSGFARGVSRSDIERGAEEIEIELHEHIAIVLRAMQDISETLEL